MVLVSFATDTSSHLSLLKFSIGNDTLYDRCSERPGMVIMYYLVIDICYHEKPIILGKIESKWHN